ncbi:MAG: three-Cys-motif partner protein TcmP [Treponema sp.]|nr:three-Cys-motif partner protein TcmP [Treponema sp.]
MAKDINQDKFTDETQLKLQIFAECFREWIPVFIHDLYTKGVFIFDFFAGTGKDPDGNYGSPLILLNEAKGENCKYCNVVKKNNKKIYFVFNEKIESKQNELKQNIEEYLETCKKQNNCGENCIYQYRCDQKEFKDALQDELLEKYLHEKDYAKFALLDQYGFSQVDEQVFSKLISSPKTDFIFFISSSFINRFKELPQTKRYIDTNKIQFDEERPMDCHRLITDYYRNLIPEDKEYYLHHFTIKKGANYWGLIFGTSHSFGMEKFLRVCWNNDPLSGESNFNINNDYSEDSLFYDKNNTVKKQSIKNEIKDKILSSEITDNITGFKFTLKNGCLPELFTEVVKELEKENIIKRTGELNYSSTQIHRVDKYDISLVGKI